MAGKIVKFVCELIVFACVLWRFSADWPLFFLQQFDEAAFILQIVVIMISSFALVSAVLEIVREIQQRRREKEENRIGPDL